MNRRELLSAIVGTGTIPAVALTRRRSERSTAPVDRTTRRDREQDAWINRTGVNATVVAGSTTSVTVELCSSTPLEPFSLCVSKRAYPTGRTFATVEGPLIEANVPLDRRVSVAVDEFPRDSSSVPWLYVIEAKRGETANRYLCESNPFVGSKRNAATAGAEPLELSRSETGYRRRNREGRYDLEFRWTDGENATWTLEHSLSKSAFERARARPRGYARTFLDSRTNPYAGHLGERLVSDAVRPEPADDDRSTTEAQWLDRTVRFVQSFEYVSDMEAAGAFDYHRMVEETLVDGACDCKDGTYLLAGLLSHPPFGYGTALVLMPDHMLLGARKSDLPDRYADRETIFDSPFVAVETTSKKPIGTYRDEPISAIVSPEYQRIDPETIDDIVDRQLRLLKSHYSESTSVH
ncbi:hypothetical protein AB7C87_15460 [Natrarchaeobius sp. A-rgal3]|uniref:hypothetical protein n=1 Tax=Natrarchaeobius versutus TaxID=1679078 RepID=UPI00350FD2B6